MSIRPFILLSLCSLLFFNGATAGQGKKDSIRSYYTYINKAEMAIVHKDYPGAKKSYQTAFTYKYPNGRDLYNAFIVAYGVRDSALAKNYLEWLSYKYFYFSGDTSIPLNRYLSGCIDSIQNSGYNDTMKRTMKFYSSIYKADQAVRKKEPIDTTEINRTDSLNLAAIKDFIFSNGFPSFERTGFYTNMGSPFNNGMFWLVQWHQRPNNTILDSLTEKAVLDGNFPPVDWATILALREGKEKDPYHMLVKEGEKLSPGQIKEIDRKRASINLEPLADYKLKLKRAVYIRGEADKIGGYSFPVLALLNENLVGYLVVTGAMKK